MVDHMHEAVMPFVLRPAGYYMTYREFPEQEPHSCTGQFNIQG